jgi:hypothetical protein
VLKNEEWRKWSDNHIAKQCGVSHPVVGKIRKKLYPNTKFEESTYINKHGKTTEMNTGKIGKNSKKTSKSKTQVIQTILDFESSTQPVTTKENNEDKNNTVDKRRYVERLEENFKFVKTEILKVTSSSAQENQKIREALNLIHHVLTGYLEELS